MIYAFKGPEVFKVKINWISGEWHQKLMVALQFLVEETGRQLND